MIDHGRTDAGGKLFEGIQWHPLTGGGYLAKYVMVTAYHQMVRGGELQLGVGIRRARHSGLPASGPAGQCGPHTGDQQICVRNPPRGVPLSFESSHQFFLSSVVGRKRASGVTLPK